MPVVVHPPLIGYLARSRADELAASGLFGDTAEALRVAWRNVSSEWDATMASATSSAACAGRLDERVGGEWSFLETLRHLIFVTDVWVGDVVRETPSAYHRWGIPPHFVADRVVPEQGLAVDERPSLASVLEVRASRRSMVTDELASMTDEGLARVCVPRDGQFSVVGALQTVVFEEWAHLQYGRRDLAALESS